VFKADRIYIVQGDGPGATGVGGDFFIQTIATDEGCIAQKSVVTFPGGVIFLGKKGFMQLSRDLQVSFIGAPVSTTVTTATGVVYSAVLVPTKNQVRFTLPSTTVVYDYYQGQWMVWPIYDDASGATATAYAACALGGAYCWAGALGMVYFENDALAYDGSNSHMIALRAVTGWIHTSTLAGYQRINEILFTGENMLNCDLNVVVGIDYSTTSNVSTFTPTGSGITQYRLIPVAGKCEALQITLITVPSTSATRPVMLGLDLEVQADTRSYKGLGQGFRR